MMVLAGGLMVAGLVAGAFAPFYVCIITTILCIIFMEAASWKAAKKERQAESWRAAYPSYKY